MRVDEIKRLVIAGINRFMMEDAPCWSQKNLEKLIGDLESPECREALKSLENDRVIKIVAHPGCYFVIAEDYIVREAPAEYQKTIMDHARELIKTFS